ncbi:MULTISPECIES: CvfB family protein [unclassified Arsukibacterium]|uniref:CvfB family protein n=1 Tax=unclassified Arsukibacterium TaxID=2635278 RepID=UPI000C49E48F|nr:MULTISPECIES: S1-like domain-containing RNA-binding protein [unclassified Arsukibacterium]MAA94746.1 GntR family transcriptional regulator [Rheinheimera sp.]MBM33896.1 GntR family transcriptional regulator [Rheinheimera sp.]HAW93735.1 GntR family transcriptional regulator [Candidatus Azambacteria bacterium]|tara:strand:- start:57709 stop:58542 length:834 start_codon:yes stop_codon:yes gene_type:complete
MIALGTLNTLTVKKQVKFGFYLDGLSWGEILLPNNVAPAGLEIGQQLEVFLYLDSEDQLIATTEKPAIMVGKVAMLPVVAVTKVGAFLNWGLKKDLLVPFSEQQIPLKEGQKYLVYCYVDVSNRIVASTKLDRHLHKTEPRYNIGDKVDIIVSEQTDIGYKVVVEQCHWGVLYKNEVFKPLRRGDRLTAYIVKVRDDGKIDLRLNATTHKQALELTTQIMTKLAQNGGKLALTDKSSPELIYQAFGVSKKAYKQAIGALYKDKKIVILDAGIMLVGS